MRRCRRVGIGRGAWPGHAQLMPYPYVALTVLLFGLTGLFSLAAASSWGKVSDSTGEISPSKLRTAAGALMIVLGLLGMSCLWVVFLAFDRFQ